MPSRRYPKLNEELATQLDYYRLLRRTKVISKAELEREVRRLAALQERLDNDERSRQIGKLLKEEEAKKKAKAEERKAKRDAGIITVSFTVYQPVDEETEKDKKQRSKRRREGGRVVIDGAVYQRVRDRIITTVKTSAMKGLNETIYAVDTTSKTYTRLDKQTVERLRKASVEFESWIHPYGYPTPFIEFLSIERLPVAKPFKRAQVRNRNSDMLGIAFRNVNVETTGSGDPATWIQKPKFFYKDGCGVMIIQNLYTESFEKMISKRKYSKEHELSLERILSICRGDTNTADLSLTLGEFKKFFEKYNLKLTVMDIQGQELVEFSYYPAKENKDLAPRHVFVLQHDNHLYLINHNVQGIARSVIPTDVDIDESSADNELSVNNRYYIRDTKTQRYLWLNNISELFALNMKETEQVHDGQLLIICPCDLDFLLQQLIAVAGYQPRISFSQGCITGVYMRIDGIEVCVRKPCDDVQQADKQLFDEAEFQKYNEWNDKLYNSLINVNNKSTYNPQVFALLRQFRRSPLVGRFHDVEGEAVAGDFCKAYTSILLDMKYFPVVSGFDSLVEYKGEPLEPYSQYYVSGFLGTDRDFILFDADKNFVSGITLIEYAKENPSIMDNVVWVLKPFRLAENSAKRVIKDLWKSDLTEKQKKDIVNHNIGHCGKLKNTKERIMVFQDFDEAVEYARQMRGTVIPVSIHGLKLYLMRKAAEEELSEGFMMIQHMVYDMMRLKLWQAAKGHELLAVKTDCLWVKPFNFTEKEKPRGEKAIGKVWWYKDPVPDVKRLAVKQNSLQCVMLPKRTKHEFVLNNERDVAEYAQIFEQNKHVFVGAVVPGAGKTHACVEFLKGKKALCCAPIGTQVFSLAEKSGLPACTVDKLLGLVVGLDDKRGVDISEFEYVLIDEVAMLTVGRLWKLFMLMRSNPKVRFIATGDVFQNKPIEDYELNVNAREYYRSIHNFMFPNQIMLGVPKRFKTEEQNERILKMKTEILACENPYQLKAFFHKWFKRIDKLSDIKGTVVSYRDKSVAAVLDKYLHNLTVPTDNFHGYYVGMTLLCRENIRVAKRRTMRNFRYTVEKVGDVFTLKDHESQLWEIDFATIKKSFRFNYALTGHAIQGITLENAMTIFDYDFKHVEKEWLWTAISRVRDLDEVYFFDGELVETMKDCRLRNLIQQRIQGHMYADKQAGRDISEDYIDLEYVESMISKMGLCPGCGSCLADEWSIDRIENTLAHVKGNVRMVCLGCNHSGGHK